jgi:transcription initiation factor IIE alpha subunit
MEIKGLYAVVPISILHNKELTPGEVVFFTKLLNICNKGFYVDISNGDLAKLFNMHIDSVKQFLRKLKNKKLIRVEDVYNTPYTFIQTRRIYCEGLWLS